MRSLRNILLAFVLFFSVTTPVLAHPGAYHIHVNEQIIYFSPVSILIWLSVSIGLLALIVLNHYFKLKK